jgi:Amt family ammonium transporter
MRSHCLQEAPAAGVVATWGAIVIGLLSGSIPWVTMNIAGKKFKVFHMVDDVLGVFHTHCVAGFVGGMAVGLFATAEGCAAYGLTNNGGAIEGNWKQVSTPSFRSLIIRFGCNSLGICSLSATIFSLPRSSCC